MNSIIGVKVAFTADTKQAEAQMKKLQTSLSKISSASNAT